MKAKFLLFLLIIGCLLLIGCSQGKESARLSDRGEYYPYETDVDGEDNQDQYKVKAGQLTASAYFDNDHYSFWNTLLGSNQEQDSLFQNYNIQFSFRTLNRIKVTIPGVVGAKVTIEDDFAGVTNANGEVYLFPNIYKEEYNIKIEYLNHEGEGKVVNEKISSDAVIDIDDAKSQTNRIELMFVIDTTGSMTDEMDYLKSEIEDVIQKVKDENEGVEILLALLFYRDLHDDYVTKYFDFTTDIAEQKQNLAKQKAAGGGDFPEAVDVALQEAILKQWSTGTATRILVHVADAPAHDTDVTTWNSIVLSAASMGIRIITVASSGIDKKTEYFFRCQSMLTNGVYTYLTNHSGIGGDHIDATVEKMEAIEYLNAMLVRLINGFHSGIFADAVHYYNQ